MIKEYYALKNVANINKLISKYKVVKIVASIQDFSRIKTKRPNAQLFIPFDSNLMEACEKRGYVEFEDYIVEVALEKQIVVIYGNCHTGIIGEILEKYPALQKDYYIAKILPVHIIKDINYFEREVFKICDVFIHQSIQEKNRYGKEYASSNLIQKLKPQCRVIAIPNVYHLPHCFFPQYDEKVELKKKNGSATVFFRDKIIDQEFLNGASIKEISKKYNTYFLDKEEDIRLEYAKFIDKVRVRESEWDIKISGFIDMYYQKERLFNDPNHPTTYFLKYIAKQLLCILLSEVDEEYIDNMNVGLLDSYEMPIVDAVYNALGMHFRKPQYIRKTGVKVRRVDMDVSEYILQYISMEWTNPDVVSNKLRIKSILLYFWLKIWNLFCIFYRGILKIKYIIIKR